MRLFILMIMLTSLTLLSAEELQDYRWKKRVILLFSGNKLPQQKAELTKELSGLKERDVIILEADLELEKKYTAKPGQLAILLLGKDGGEKFRSEKVINAEKIFSIIDAMPMRKEEMQQEK